MAEQIQSLSQMRSSLNETRTHINETVGALETRMHEIQDWKFLVQHYPVRSVLVAIGLGFTVSGMFNVLLLRSAKGYLGQFATATVTGLLARQFQKMIWTAEKTRPL